MGYALGAGVTGNQESEIPEAIEETVSGREWWSKLR